MNNHGVCRRCITETDVRHFKSGALRAITNIAEKEYASYGKLIYMHTDRQTGRQAGRQAGRQTQTDRQTND